MRERHKELDTIGVQLAGVATREAYQARQLIEDGLDVELLLDSNDHIRSTLGVLRTFRWWQMLRPQAAAVYVNAIRNGRRSDPIWSETTTRPGLVLLDGNLTVLSTKMGAHFGDYPTADEVISAVASVLTTEP